MPVGAFFRFNMSSVLPFTNIAPSFFSGAVSSVPSSFGNSSTAFGFSLFIDCASAQVASLSEEKTNHGPDCIKPRRNRTHS